MIADDLLRILMFLMLGIGVSSTSFHQRKEAMRPLILYLFRFAGLCLSIWALISLAFYFAGSR